MERREKQPRVQHKDFRGPLILDKGKNFYDQPPFNTIITGIVENYPVEKHPDMESELRSGLTILSRRHQYDSREKLERELAKYQNNQYSAKGLIAGDGNIEEGEAIKSALTQLSEFPEWLTYVSGKLDRGIYQPTGNYNPRSTKPSMPPSYFGWLQGRIARREKIQEGFFLQVVADTFPQETPEGSDLSSVVFRLSNTRGFM